MTIAEACRRMQRVVDGLDDAIDTILNNVEPDIVKMQTDRLQQGIFVSGNPIYPDYKPYTVAEKLRKEQDAEHVTLRDTGAFYNAIYAARIGDEVIIESGDEKNDELVEKYGEGIFGLTKEDKPDIKEKTTDGLVEYVKDITGFE